MKLLNRKSLNMQKKLSIVILLLTLIGLSLKAQNPMSLYYFETVPQSNLLNAAKAPRCNVYIGIPGINTIYTNLNSNLSPNALLQDSDLGSVTLISHLYDYNKLYNEINNGLYIRNYELIAPILFGFKLKDGYVNFSISEKVKMNGYIPKDVFKMLDKGFPDGSSFDLSDFILDAQAYQEYSLGYSRNISQKLRIGAHVKLLQGFYSMKSDINNFKLNTSKDLWQLDVKGTIYTSAPIEVVSDEEGIIDSIKVKDDIEEELIQKLSDFSNWGLAFDLGMTYEYSDLWSFSAAINDLGFINWNDNLNSINFNGKYDFEGLEIDNDNVDSIANAMDDLVDTIKTVIDYKAGNDNYFTGLGTKVYLGAEFKVAYNFSLGLISRTTFDHNYFHQEFNLSANANLYRILSTNVNYNISTEGKSFLGLGIALNFNPLQFYAVLDHIPIKYNNYWVDGQKYPGPANSVNFNVMFGFNLIFGAKGFTDKPKIDSYSEF